MLVLVSFSLQDSFAEECNPIEIDYTTHENNIINFCKSSESNTLIGTIDSFDGGTVSIEVPKRIVDAVLVNCEPDTLFVLINTVEAEPVEIDAFTYRTLEIELPVGDVVLEIIGANPIITPVPTQYCGSSHGYDSQYAPPLKQIKSGMLPEQIFCNSNFTLIQKASTGDSACVKPETKTILIERGDRWTADVSSYDTELKDIGSETLEISLSVYTSFDNGVTEIINPDHEPLRYRDTIQVIDDTYLSKNVQKWSDTSPDELQTEPEMYDGDEFYTELGRLLMKNEMQYQMNDLGIVNAQDDFEVISGMSLDSLPPHIGFSSIIHATDGHYYWLQGGTHANQVNYYKTTQLQYPNPTEMDFGDSRISPDVIPQVYIVQKAEDGKNDLKSIPPFTVLHQPGDVEFYNDATGALTVYLTKDGLEEFSFENSPKIVIQSKSDAVWSFADSGSYSWSGMVPIMIEGNEYELNTGGGILVLSDDMSDLSKEEKIETARMMLITSSLPIMGIGQQGEENTLFISLSSAINELLPESRQYYLEAAQKLIPFEDISIKLDG